MLLDVDTCVTMRDLEALAEDVQLAEEAMVNGALVLPHKALKDSKTMRLTPALSERLVHARAELKRLSDWARWGGNVSREELIKAVEQLGTQSLAMAELAKKVGSMRDRWKALDTLESAHPVSVDTYAEALKAEKGDPWRGYFDVRQVLPLG